MIGENAMKDSELIQKMHSGNKEAVSIIVERYYADIYRFCLYMVQTENDAYDIAQETFIIINHGFEIALAVVAGSDKHDAVFGRGGVVIGFDRRKNTIDSHFELGGEAPEIQR